MQSLRVAAVSMNSEFGKSTKMWETIGSFCEQAAGEDADLVLFPELLVHGHCNPDTWELAEPVPDGPSVERLVQLARRFDRFLSVGMSEKENDIVYNAQVLVGPSGYIGKQRKIHLSRDETFFYKGGREISVFDIGKCKVGTAICYDNRFPEIHRILALRGADVILMPHAARPPIGYGSMSESEFRKFNVELFKPYAMRAMENSCFCVFADQAGRAGLVDSLPPDHHNQPFHPGGAFVYAPDGRILNATQAEEIRDEMIVQDLDARLLAECRSDPNYTLRTRRPELFGELTREQVSS